MGKSHKDWPSSWQKYAPTHLREGSKQSGLWVLTVHLCWLECPTAQGLPFLAHSSSSFFFFFLTNSRFFGNPVSSKFTGTIFQQYLFTLCLCITNILITLPILKILHQWKYYSSLKAQIMVNSLPTKYVIIKVGTLVFRHNAIAHLIDYSIV